MRLSPGQFPPALSTKDFLGQKVDLQQHRGHRVLLSFFRYASCPVCNLRVRSLIVAHERLTSQGLSVIAVFQSPSESIAEYVGKQDAPFPIVPDPEMELYKRFGVEIRWGGLLNGHSALAAFKGMGNGFAPGRIEGPINRTPADFLIDPDGRIAVAHYGKNIDDHLELDIIEDWLREGEEQKPRKAQAQR